MSEESRATAEREVNLVELPQNEEQLWREFDRKLELLRQHRDLPERVREIIGEN